MTDLMVRDIEPMLMERIQRVAVARGWTEAQAVVALIEQGLFASEKEMHGGAFRRPEVDVLSEAIAALRALPPGRGF
ncbi:hypothetical protein HF319_08810 [Xanthomonas sp. Kuri4-1]